LVTAFDELNTAEFIAELQGGSGPCFDHLARALFEPLRRYLVAEIGVPEPDAEECAQDALFKVHLKAGTFHNDGRSKFTTWIFQIAKNCALDFLDVFRPKQREFMENDLPVRWHGQFAGRNAALLAGLMEGLGKLSGEDQQILLWRAQDFTNADIGRWLGIKPGTIRVRYCRAKKKLGVSDDRPEEPGVSTGSDITD
jgi:RNA polymerase sigma factor (sigma-70 family)